MGLERQLGTERRHRGRENVAAGNGRVIFETGAAGLARANIRSRFAERILLELGCFPARSFEELFEGVKAIAFEDWLPRDAAFPVKGWALESALHSVPDCQSIIKRTPPCAWARPTAFPACPRPGRCTSYSSPS